MSSQVSPKADPLRAAVILWRCAALVLILCVSSALADTYDDMRTNWFNNLTGGTSYNAADPDVASATASLTSNANSYWTILKATKPFSTTPFSDIPLGSDSDNITDVYSRLETMCQAYWAIGGSLYQNAALQADIISTLDWLNANIYNSATKSYGNWFAWNIGIPLNLNNITILLYDSLTAAQIANYMGAIDHFTPSPTTVSTSGANCAWCSSIVGLRGVIVKDSTRIAAASAQFSALTAYVSSPDGFYTEGSYLGHGTYSYNGGYGLYMLQQLADGYYLFNPTALSPLPASKRAIVYGWVLNSYQALMYQGKIPYYSIGREISRGPSDGRGESISATAAEIASGDTSATAGQVLSFAKNVFATSGSNYSGVGGVGAVIRMKSLMSNAAVTAAADPVGARIFPVMDRATAVQNGWSASVAWYSTRTHNYESINGENLKGWHLSDGLLYLDNADWNQFNGNFWATVNSYRLPGTTVNANTATSENLANGSTFAGGATLNGLYGALGFVLQPANGQTLTANKSWFLFDDQVVCLGSGITSTDGKTVETVVENRKLAADGSNLLTVNGTGQSTSLGWSATQSGVNWMHLAGTVSGADIGYYFPTAATLSLLREARTSSWSAIGVGSTASVTDNYLTTVFSHGTSPTASSYAYILLPGMSASQVAAYAAAPEVSVLQNDVNAASVYDAKLAASGTVFWQDQSAKTSIDKIPTYLTVDKKAVVMTQTTGNQFTITVSDPTQANTTGINVTVSNAFASLVSADTGISVTQFSPTLKFNVATSGARGKTFQAVLSTAVSATGAIPVASVSASGDDGDVPSNTLDNNFSTRWSAHGDGQWIQFDFANAWQVSSAALAFYGGTARTTNFDVLASLDGTTWTTVSAGCVSSGASNGLQSFPLPTETWAWHMRILGHGNSQGTGWNSYTEVRFFGSTAVATFSDYSHLNFTPAQLADPTTSGLGACPAGDGVTNLMKYSQGLPPMTNMSRPGGGLPSAQTQNGYLTLTYVRMKNATDLTYTPEVSGDLSTWESGPAYTTQVSATDIDSATQQVVARSNTPVSAGGMQAIRLRVNSAAGITSNVRASVQKPVRLKNH